MSVQGASASMKKPGATERWTLHAHSVHAAFRDRLFFVDIPDAFVSVEELLPVTLGYAGVITRQSVFVPVIALFSIAFPFVCLADHHVTFLPGSVKGEATTLCHGDGRVLHAQHVATVSVTVYFGTIVPEAHIPAGTQGDACSAVLLLKEPSIRCMPPGDSRSIPYLHMKRFRKRSRQLWKRHHRRFSGNSWRNPASPPKEKLCMLSEHPEPKV